MKIIVCSLFSIFIFFSSILAEDKLIWSSTFNQIKIQLISGKNNQSHLKISSLPTGPKSVSHISDLREIRLRLPDARFTQGRLVPPVGNGFIEKVVFSGQHEIFFTLAKDSWSTRSMQERKDEIVISGIRTINPSSNLEDNKNDIVVESAVLEQGNSNSQPIIKIWSAEVKESPIKDKLEKKELEKTKEPNLPEAARAALVYNIEDYAADISVSNENMLLMPEIKSELLIHNKGTKTITLKMLSEHDKKILNIPEIIFNPEKLTLKPNQKKSIIVRVKDKSVNVESLHKVGIYLDFDGQSPLEPIRSFNAYVQPASGTASVSWLREDRGIRFVNRGDITTVFRDIKICNPSCYASSDIVLEPNKEYLLKASKTSSVILEQNVGNNKQSGVIPAAVG